MTQPAGPRPSPVPAPSPIDGHQDPPGEAPWAMQVVVRYDKAALPDEDLVCATTARAVVRLLDDERSLTGEWQQPVRRWRDGRIRKLVRRARGVRWDRAQDVPGVTVRDGRAQVRAFVPMPARPLPPELDALQVSGTTFPPAEGTGDGDGEGRPPLEPVPVVTVALSPRAAMSSGKAAAQCAHGAQLAYEALASAPRLRGVLDHWRAQDLRVRVLRPDEATWAGLEAPVSVVDAGLTELDGPTETVRAWWA